MHLCRILSSLSIFSPFYIPLNFWLQLRRYSMESMDLINPTIQWPKFIYSFSSRSVWTPKNAVGITSISRHFGQDISNVLGPRYFLKTCKQKLHWNSVFSFFIIASKLGPLKSRINFGKSSRKLSMNFGFVSIDSQAGVVSIPLTSDHIYCRLRANIANYLDKRNSPESLDKLLIH